MSSTTQSDSAPKIVSARRTSAPPRRPNGTFLSNRNPRQQPGSRRNRPFGPLAPPEDEPTRLAAVLGHRNALLEAGRVLLRALVDMSALIDTGHDARLRDLLLEEVRVFERLCVRANIRVDHRIGARYCLCTALDEAAMRELAARGDASGSAAWASDALTQRIGEDNQGGLKVYALTLRLLDDAGDHWPLLELIYRIFSLGFEGRDCGASAHRPERAVAPRHDGRIAATERLFRNTGVAVGGLAVSGALRAVCLLPHRVGRASRRRAAPTFQHRAHRAIQRDRPAAGRSGALVQAGYDPPST